MTRYKTAGRKERPGGRVAGAGQERALAPYLLQLAGRGMDVAAAAVLRQRPVADEVVLPPTPDQLIVLVTRGKAMIESSDGGRWRRAAYVPGQIGLTVPGCSTRLRWRSTSDAVLTTPHVSLPGPSARARRSGAAGCSHDSNRAAVCRVIPFRSWVFSGGLSRSADLWAFCGPHVRP